MTEFPFEEGDAVLVRVRENKTGGPLRAKFVARCQNIRPGPTLLSPTATFKTPWRTTVRLRATDAEFEQIEDYDEVSF